MGQSSSRHTARVSIDGEGSDKARRLKGPRTPPAWYGTMRLHEGGGEIEPESTVKNRYYPTPTLHNIGDGEASQSRPVSWVLNPRMYRCEQACLSPKVTVE